VLARTAGLDVARSYPRFRADCLGYLAIAETLEGHPSSARRTANEAVEITADTEGAQCAPAVLVALAVAALEQYEIEAARAYADAATACGQLREDPVSRGLSAEVLAGLERADGDLAGALSRLDEAATELRPTDPWLTDHLRVVAAELSVASGRAELALDALDAVVERDEPAVAVVAAAAFAEQGQEEAVGSLLATVRDGEPGLRARVSELLLEGALDRSLRLAEPEGLRRPFREAGPAVQRALAADARLLLENRWLHPSDEVPPVESAGIVEPLTPRELEVLGHLQELLTTEEIAEKMFVSVNTVRTHVRSILRKLGVSRRNAAVRKARELGMVGG
jgi:LuxR family maltose regulon positive regulatory protein